MISLLLFGAVALLLVSAAMAPISALGWWAGWFGEGAAPSTADATPRVSSVSDARVAPHYLVYLSGIGAITADSVPDEEIKWLAAFEQRIGASALARDVFPYTVVGAGLTNERFFNRLWRWIEQLRLTRAGSAQRPGPRSQRSEPGSAPHRPWPRALFGATAGSPPIP